MADGKFIQLIDGKEYNLWDYGGRIQYAPNKYYSHTAKPTTDNNGVSTDNFTAIISGWPSTQFFTIANNQAFGNDPWIKTIQTNYGMKLNGASTPSANLHLIDPKSFANFKTKVYSKEFSSGSITIDSSIVNMDRNFIIVIQAPGGKGGTASGIGKSGSGGGSGGCLVLLIDPRYCYDYSYINGSSTKEKTPATKFTLSIGNASVSSSHGSNYGVHLYATNPDWLGNEILASVVAGYNGNGGAAVGGAGGHNITNTNYRNKAFWVLADLKGVKGGRGGDSNHAPGEDMGSTTIYATNSTSYKTEEYNRIVVGGFTGGADDTATSFNAQTGGGAASYFANGGAGAIGSNNAGGNGSKGSGGGGGCASRGTGGTGGGAYIEIYR